MVGGIDAVVEHAHSFAQRRQELCVAGVARTSFAAFGAGTRTGEDPDARTLVDQVPGDRAANGTRAHDQVEWGNS